MPTEAPSASPAPTSAPASVDRMRLPASLAKMVVADGAQAVKSFVSKEATPLPVSGEKRGKLPSPSQSPGSSQHEPPEQGNGRFATVVQPDGRVIEGAMLATRKLRKVPPASGQG